MQIDSKMRQKHHKKNAKALNVKKVAQNSLIAIQISSLTIISNLGPQYKITNTTIDINSNDFPFLLSFIIFYYFVQQSSIEIIKFGIKNKKGSLIMNILSNMDQIADIIIRPNRYLYKPVDLGPKIINISGKTIYHHDFQVKNSRGLLLKASLYTEHEDIKDIKTVLIYLHCNSGCRIQGLAYMKMALNNQFSYVIFDFAGSGLSQGKYVSLGYYEAQDIKSVIKHLKKRINQRIKLVLWGRSMGAVATLRYLLLNNTQKSVLAAVFDSPFQSLKQLFLQIGKQKTNLPKIVLQVALKYLKPTVQNKASFDIDQVNLNGLDKIDNCPAVFIASKKDSLIPFVQMDNIFKQYKSQKQMLFVEESHNQPRNVNVIKEVFSTIKKFINRIDAQQILFRSQLPNKDQSRKKLQLTIKSFSQKDLLLLNKSSQTPRALKGGGNNQISFPHLEKRQISCLFQKRRKSKNTVSQDIVCQETQTLNTSSLIRNKKREIGIRKFFKDQNEIQIPKNNVLKFRSLKQYNGSSGNIKWRDQERKTMQHIANKKPPYIDNNKLYEFRSSLQSKYRSEFRI